MKSRLTILTACLLSVVCTQLFAQEMPEMPGPVKEHEWLKQFVGEWEFLNKGTMGPDQPAIETKGTVNSKMLGGIWVVNEMKMEAFGSPMTALQTIGYDPEKKKYVGTWVDSMMNHMWHYEGTLDESGKKLTLEAEGPDFSEPGKKAMFRDAYEFKSADEIIATSSIQAADGTWSDFMTGKMTRIKKGNE